MYDWQALIVGLQAHMSQSQIASNLDISQAFVSYLSNGRRKTVSHETGERILRLCLTLGVNVQTKTTRNKKARPVS